MSEPIPFTREHEAVLFACRDDIVKLDNKIDAVHDKLDAKIDAVHDKLDAKIDAVHDKLDANFRKLDERTHLQGIKLETLESKVDTILEIVTHINSRYIQQDEHEAKLENHEHRISALEAVAKRDPNC